MVEGWWVRASLVCALRLWVTLYYKLGYIVPDTIGFPTPSLKCAIYRKDAISLNNALIIAIEYT